MALRYQSAASTSAFLSAGTAGQILQTNSTGAAPAWVSQSTLSAGTATNANNLSTVQQTASATYYPTFVDANNVTGAQEAFYTTSSFTINPATGAVTYTGNLNVGGIASVSNVTSATSTST
jgi:hypothetical protein